MQIEQLYEKVLECKQNDVSKGFSAAPRGQAAPHDETLFDGVRLYAESADGSHIEISGTVTYWNPVDGYSQESTVIRQFDDIDSCLAWLKNKGAASDECATTLYWAKLNGYKK